MALPEAVKTAKGTYYRVYVWDPVNRKKVWLTGPDGKSRKFPDYKSALDAEMKARNELDEVFVQNGVPLHRQQRSMTIAEYLDVWLPTQGGTKQTRKTRGFAANRVREKFGDVRVADLLESHVRAWIIEMQDAGRARKTIEVRLWCLRNLMNSAQKEGLRSDNPAADVRLGKVRRESEPVRVSVEVFDRLVAHMPSWFVPGAILAYECGLRAGEVAGLRWFRFLDLDGDAPTVVVKDVMDEGRTVRSYPKSGKTRYVPLTRRAVEALRELREWRASRGEHEDETDFVIRNSRGNPLPVEQVSRVIGRAWRDAGLTGERPHFHDLRHTFSVDLMRAGVPVRVLQGLLGHESLETTQQYMVEVSVDDMREWLTRREKGATVHDIEQARTRRTVRSEVAG